MKTIILWTTFTVCILLVVWCNLNTFFINANTERIENIEHNSSNYSTDTIYIIIYPNLELKVNSSSKI